MALTRTQQQSTLAQGLAIGCLALGITEFKAEWIGLEGGLSRAMQHWRFASEFRTVKLGMKPNDLRIIIRKSQNRIMRVAAWEQNAGTLTPYIEDESWTVEEAADVLSSHEGISLQDWKQLAHSWLTEGRIIPRA